MLAYFILLLYILIGVILEKYNLNKQKNIWPTVFDPKIGLLVMFLFSSLRGNGSQDYFNYIAKSMEVTTLNQLLRGPIEKYYDFGFRFLAYVRHLLNASPQFVIMSMNAISIFFISQFIIEKSVRPWISLLVFFPILLLFDMHHSRAAVAMSSGLIFFLRLREKKYVQSIPYILISILFHKSSLVLLFVPILMIFIDSNSQTYFKVRASYNRTFIMLLLFIVFSFIHPFSIVEKIFINFPNKFTNKIVAYINSKWSYTFKLYDPRILFSIFILFVNSYLFNNKRFEFDLVIYDFFFVVSLFIMIFFREITIFVIRFSAYFNMFDLVLIPYTLQLLEWELEVHPNRYPLKFIYFGLILGLILYSVGIIFWQVEYIPFWRNFI